MDRGVCNACRAPIAWATSYKSIEAGDSPPKKMPLDPVPDDEKGNVLVNGQGFAMVFGDHDKAIAYARGLGLDEGTYMPHHATCPHADQFRQSRSSPPRRAA